MNLGQMRRPWQADTGPNRYRRALYTFFWRATPNPFLTTFDAPGGVQTCTRRFRSNTPLQALTLLNDPAFVEIAQGSRGGSRPIGRRQRATETGSGYAFRALSGPRTHEPGAGDSGSPAPEQAGGDGKKSAGWMNVARVLLNLDEFVTRE